MAEGGYKEIISRPEVSFWVPIVFSAVTMTLSFGALMTRVALIEQKQDTQIALTKELVEQNNIRMTDILSRVGTLALKVNTLETRAGIK